MKKGIDGLVDRRGKAKPEAEMAEVDRLKAENRILKAKLRSIQLEEDLRKNWRRSKGGIAERCTTGK